MWERIGITRSNICLLKFNSNIAHLGAVYYKVCIQLGSTVAIVVGVGWVGWVLAEVCMCRIPTAKLKLFLSRLHYMSRAHENKICRSSFELVKSKFVRCPLDP